MHRLVVSTYVMSSTSADSAANSRSEEPIPARLDTGVSYASFECCSENSFGNAAVEIHRSVRETVLLEGGEKTVAHIHGKRQQVVLVGERCASGEEPFRTVLGVMEIVALNNGRVVCNHNVSRQQAAQHADGCLEDTHIHVKVEVFQVAVRQEPHSLPLKQSDGVDEQVVQLQHVKRVQRVDQRHVRDVALGEGSLTAAKRVQLRSGEGAMKIVLVARREARRASTPEEKQRAHFRGDLLPFALRVRLERTCIHSTTPRTPCRNGTSTSE